jgi:hypothetical protein
MFVDIGEIVDHHSMTPISTNITSHFNSLSDGQQFHYQDQQKKKAQYRKLKRSATRTPPKSVFRQLYLIV